MITINSDNSIHHCLRTPENLSAIAAVDYAVKNDKPTFGLDTELQVIPDIQMSHNICNIQRFAFWKLQIKRTCYSIQSNFQYPVRKSWFHLWIIAKIWKRDWKSIIFIDVKDWDFFSRWQIRILFPKNMRWISQITWNRWKQAKTKVDKLWFGKLHNWPRKVLQNTSSIYSLPHGSSLKLNLRFDH